MDVEHFVLEFKHKRSVACCGCVCGGSGEKGKKKEGRKE